MRLAAAALLALLANTAQAHDPAGHAKFHHWYQHFKQPGTGMSCCDGKDCRPISSYRVTPNGVEILVNGIWFFPPPQTVIESDTIDGGAHFCGIDGKPPHTFCAIIPKGGV